MLDKFKQLNKRVTEASASVSMKSWFPLILYALTFFLIDFFAFYTVAYSKYLTIERYFGRVIFSGIFFGAVLVFLPKKKLSAILYAVISVFLLCYQFAQMLYYTANQHLFRFNVLFAAKEGAGFATAFMKKIPAVLYLGYVGLLLLIALTVFLVLRFAKAPDDVFSKGFKAVLSSLLLIISGAVYFVVYPLMLSSGMTNNYGSYDKYNYDNFLSSNDMYKTADINLVMYRDIFCSVRGLIFKSDKTAEIKDYFAERPEHTPNEMSGVFKGKNLILIQMETFEHRLITEDICPNIYRLSQEGLDLTRFYTSRFNDAQTFGTEACVQTGLYSPAGIDFQSALRNNTLPYTLGALLRAEGYSANEFHYNDPAFYGRGDIYEKFSFENYIRYEDAAVNKEQDFSIDDTLVTDGGIYNKLIENDKFYDFVITYSAHSPYSTDDELYLEAIRRRPGLAVSDPSDIEGIFKAKATLTDDMIGGLLKRLEEDDLLDDTVLILYGDHFNPAMYDLLSVNEESVMNTPFIIYSKDIAAQKVDKVCAINDVLPTLVNMFGLYDCGQYIGHDIFDESYEGLAYFQNLAWISPRYHFDGREVIENYTGGEVDEEYVSEMNEYVRKAIDMNSNIIFNDYYKQEE